MKNQIFFLQTVDFVLTVGSDPCNFLPPVDMPVRLQGHGQEVFILPEFMNAKGYFHEKFRSRGASEETIGLALNLFE